MKLEGAQGTDESQGKHNKGHRVKNKKNGQHKMGNGFMTLDLSAISWTLH